MGVGLAVGGVKPGKEFFAAFTEDEGEAQDQQAWYEADQMEAEVIEKYTRRGR